MNASQTTTQRLEAAIQIVEKRFGSGLEPINASLVAAVLQSLALDELAERIGDESKELGSIIAQSAAVAAGS
jgi:hypothetical protein